MKQLQNKPQNKLRNKGGLLKSKSAQITLFIVIGIVILGAVVFGLYMKAKVSKTQVKPTVYETPLQIMPVSNYIEQCLRSSAEDGLEKIGMNGGYIDASALKANELEPTEGDAVPAFSTNIAYWWHLKSGNKCTGICEFASEKPNLYRASGEPSIEGQVDVYVGKQLDNCLNSFADLRAQGFDVKVLGKPRVITSVNENDFGVRLYYPLKISRGDDSYELNEFYVVVPVDMKKIYLVAMNLTNYEASNETNYLERLNLNLISAFSGTTEEKLPSIADTEFKAAGTMWSEKNVRDNMQQLLMVYVQAIQVEGAANYKRHVFKDALAQQIYDDLIMPRAKITAPHDGLEIEFNYLNWPIYLDLNCKGGICKPEQVFTNMMIIPFGIQRYSFSYDVSYPVVVTIRDPDALYGKGYVFNFALESNLRNNEAMGAVFYPITQLDAGEASMMCDPEKRNSGETTITITDRRAKELLKDVVVTFTSGGEGCSIGLTSGQSKEQSKEAQDKEEQNKWGDWGLSQNEQPTIQPTTQPITPPTTPPNLITRMPVGCGFISFTKEGYLGESVYACNQLDVKKEVKHSLEPFRKVNITVMKKKVVKMGSKWQFLDREFPLVEKEEAVVSLERVKETRGSNGQEIIQEEYMTGFSVTTKEENPEISLVPGRYKVSAALLLNSPIVIPERKIKQSTLFGLSQTETTIPATRFEAFPEGTIDWAEENYVWQLSSEELDMVANDKGKIILYILSSDFANIPESSRTLEDLDQIGDLAQKSKDYAVYLKPRIVSER